MQHEILGVLWYFQTALSFRAFEVARISRATESRGYTDASVEKTTEIAITRYGDFTSNLLVGMTVVQNWLVMVGRRGFQYPVIGRMADVVWTSSPAHLVLGRCDKTMEKSQGTCRVRK